MKKQTTSMNLMGLWRRLPYIFNFFFFSFSLQAIYILALPVSCCIYHRFQSTQIFQCDIFAYPWKFVRRFQININFRIWHILHPWKFVRKPENFSTNSLYTYMKIQRNIWCRGGKNLSSSINSWNIKIEMKL